MRTPFTAVVIGISAACAAAEPPTNAQQWSGTGHFVGTAAYGTRGRQDWQVEVLVTFTGNGGVDVRAGDCIGRGTATPIGARIIQLRVAFAGCGEPFSRDFSGALQIGDAAAVLTLRHQSQSPDGSRLRQTLTASVTRTSRGEPN